MTHLLHTRRSKEESLVSRRPEGANRATARKTFARVVGTADTAFRAKRQRKMPEVEVGEPITKEFLVQTLEKIKSEPLLKESHEVKKEEPITKDFLLKALEDI